jgi:hypothetical protein
MKKITIVIVGNTHDKAMRFALDTTLENTPHVETVLQIGNISLGYGHHIFLRENFTVDDYNYFMIKNLWAHIKTEFVLVIQYDGMAVNKTQWTDNYFNYDYIGAPWPNRFIWISPEEKVGNGGFSLRSMKLIEALRDSFIKFENSPRFKNEDAVICQGHSSFLKKKYNIKYASIEVANQFSHEWCNPTGNTFGFHGAWNFPLFFSESICMKYLLDIPKEYWYNDKLEMLKFICNQKNYEKLWHGVQKTLHA